MIEFLKKRLEQRTQLRAALQQQEQAKVEKLVQLKSYVATMNDLLHDQRYAKYTSLLEETKKSCAAERESILRGLDEDDPQTRHERIAILTGRIMQLEYILSTPEQFLSLAESESVNGAARSPVA